MVKEDGKEEAWRVVYQKDNEPNADTLEIPSLTPFTQYRLAANTLILLRASLSTTQAHTSWYARAPAYTNLTLRQFLQYRKAQVKFDKSHWHTERQFHLRLFCLSAPSQLQHADTYYPPAN